MDLAPCVAAGGIPFRVWSAPQASHFLLGAPPGPLGRRLGSLWSVAADAMAPRDGCASGHTGLSVQNALEMQSPVPLLTGDKERTASQPRHLTALAR